jgi:hypothetical protein
MTAEQRGCAGQTVVVADRLKRIVWGVLIRADDAAVIGGNDHRKIGGGKTLEGSFRTKTKTVDGPSSSVSESELIINRWFTWTSLLLCLKLF